MAQPTGKDLRLKQIELFASWHVFYSRGAVELIPQEVRDHFIAAKEGKISEAQLAQAVNPYVISKLKSSPAFSSSAPRTYKRSSQGIPPAYIVFGGIALLIVILLSQI